MPTFLPFVRAVKAPATELLVCALILGLGASCAAAPAARVSDGPVTAAALVAAPARPPEASRGIETGTSARLASPEAEAEPRPEPWAPAEAELGSPLRLELELPYPSNARAGAGAPGADAAQDTELARWNVGGSADANAPAASPSFHPGTRVVVDVRWAKRRLAAPLSAPPRGLTSDRVQAQLRSRGYWPFRSCFEKSQREQPGSGGETRIAFTVGTRGKVRSARRLDSQLKNAAGASCLVRELLKLEFTPAPPRALALITTVALWPGDVPLPELTEPPGVSAPLVVPAPPANFDALEVQARITAVLPQLRDCFAVARSLDPSLWGRLALAVSLEIDGSVHRVGEVESRFPGPQATRCVQAQLANVVFPSVNGKPFSFVVPLRLAPAASVMTGAAATPNPSIEGEPVDGN